MPQKLRYEAILDGAGLCSWDWNLVTNEARFDKRWCQSIGYNENEVDHNVSTWQKAIHPEDLPIAMEAIDQYLKGEKNVYENIHRLKHRDGHWIWVLARARFATFDEEGKPTSLTGTHLEITEFIEQKKTNEDLEKVAHIGSWEYLICCQSFTISREVQKILGIPGKETLSLEEFLDFYSPSDKETIKKYLQACMKGLPFKDIFETFNKEQHHRWALTTGQPVLNADNQITKIRGTFQDISEIKNTLNSFDAIIHSIDDIIFEIDGQMKLVNVWTNKEELLFAPKEKLINNYFSNFLPKDLNDKFLEYISYSKVSPTTPVLEYPHPEQIGLENCSWFKAKFFWQKNLKTQERYTIVISDITKEVMIRSELQSQAQRLKSIMESSPGAVFQFVLSPDGIMRLAYVTEHINPLTGYSSKELQNDINLIFNMLAPEEREYFQSLIIQSAHELKTFKWEGQMTNRAGKKLWAKIKSHPVKQDDGSIIWHGIWLDVSEEKLKEQEITAHKKMLEHNSKLASLGEMVAGIGHEVNNPLAIARGKLEELLEGLEDHKTEKSSLVDQAQKISQALKRVELIVSGLRVFSRADHEQKVNFNIIDKIEETLQMFQGLYHQEGISIDFHFEGKKSFFNVHANEGRIQQVLINLLNNAKDANLENKKEKIEIHLIKDDDSIFIEVIDHGRGIPKDLQEKIFQPFFTTKPINKGTGIGLSLCHQILHEHEGALSFKTQENKGTTFVIQLPLVREPLSLVTKVEEKEFCDIVERKLILIVEDEAELRDYLVNRLTKLGHTVLNAADGLKALDLMKEHKNQIDLVISDVNMPELDGPGLLKQIRSDKDLTYQPKFVFCTGGTTIDLSSSDNPFHGQFDGYLYKPFTRQDINQLINKLFCLSA